MARRWATTQDDDPYDGDAWKRGSGGEADADDDSPDDPEGPGEHDRHLTDIDAPFFARCPHCGEDIYEELEKCPHCRNWLSSEDSTITGRALSRRTLLGLIVLLVLFGFLALCGYLWWL